MKVLSNQFFGILWFSEIDPLKSSVLNSCLRVYSLCFPLPLPALPYGIPAYNVIMAAQHLPVDWGDCATDQESWRKIRAITWLFTNLQSNCYQPTVLLCLNISNTTWKMKTDLKPKQNQTQIFRISLWSSVTEVRFCLLS